MATAFVEDRVEDQFVAVDYKSLTVAGLVELAQDQDRAAAGELFERYQNMVLSVAYRRMGSFTDAQELVQEVAIYDLILYY